MTTVKVMGCGGRYSYLAFLPCRLCMAETEDECKKILKHAGYQGQHEEWWSKHEMPQQFLRDVCMDSRKMQEV